MNDLERAVIEAARAVITTKITDSTPLCPGGPGLTNALLLLADEIAALNEHERAQTAAGLTEIPWAQVAEGDQVQGRSGALYPVVATKREWKMGKPTGKFVITIDMAQGRREIIRPSEAQPEAVVKRGDAGAVVDMFVNVFSSGEI